MAQTTYHFDYSRPNEKTPMAVPQKEKPIETTTTGLMKWWELNPNQDTLLFEAGWIRRTLGSITIYQDPDTKHFYTPVKACLLAIPQEN